MPCYILAYGIPTIYIILQYRYLSSYLHKWSVPVFVIFSWALISVIVSYVVPFGYGTDDYGYTNVVLGVFRKAIICIFLMIVVSKRHGRRNVVEYFMIYYSAASILYVAVTVLFVLIPPLRTSWTSLLHLNDRTMALFGSFGYVTRFGWAGFSGFRNTIDCTLSAIFLTYLFSNDASNVKIKNSHYVLGVIACFMGNMFYGRSGVIASAICVLSGLILYKRIRIGLLLRVIVVGLVLIIAVILLKNRISALNDWYIWLSSPFKNFLSTGSFNNYSADMLLKDMIFMPEKRTFWLGDGRYREVGTNLYYMHTDAGFMRQILFWGVIMTSITYFMWLLSIVSMKRDAILKIILVMMCIIFEIKGESYYELLPLFTIITAIDIRQSVGSTTVNSSSIHLNNHFGRNYNAAN